VTLRRLDTLRDGWPSLLWALAEVRGTDGSTALYQLLLGATPDPPEGLPEQAVVGPMRTPRGEAWLFDALADEELALAFCGVVAPDLIVGGVRAQPGEQSHSSLVLDEQWMLKVFRRIGDGANLDVEVTEALGRAGYGAVPVPVTVWRRGRFDLAVVRRYERSRGSGSDLAMASLRQMLQRRTAPRECPLDLTADARELGAEVARMHLALAEAFPVAPADGAAWAEDMVAQLRRVGAGRLDAERIEAAYRRLVAAEDLGVGMRIHGDLHLGQVLRLGRSWMILDFEGEPGRPAAERRKPSSPLRDTAGMTRSFHYAAGLALRELALDPEGPGGPPDEEAGVLCEAWVERNVNSFLSGYSGVDDVHRLLPSERAARDALLTVFELDKAVYEVAYELAHRPDLVELPVQAVEDLLEVEGRPFAQRPSGDAP
jgi:maltokinase